MFAIGMVWFHTDLNYVKEQSMIEKQKKKNVELTSGWFCNQRAGRRAKSLYKTAQFVQGTDQHMLAGSYLRSLGFSITIFHYSFSWKTKIQMIGELTSIWVKFDSDTSLQKRCWQYITERNSSQAEILWFPAGEGIG